MGNTTRDSESKIVLFLNWITASSTTVELCLREDHNIHYSDSRVGAFVRAMDRVAYACSRANASWLACGRKCCH